MQMELLSNAPIPEGLPASMTLLREKSRLGVPSRKSAPHQCIDERNCTAVLGLRFPCSEIVSGTVVAPSNPDTPSSDPRPGQIFQCLGGNPHFGSCSYTCSAGDQSAPTDIPLYKIQRACPPARPSCPAALKVTFSPFLPGWEIPNVVPNSCVYGPSVPGKPN